MFLLKSHFDEAPKVSCLVSHLRTQDRRIAGVTGTGDQEEEE